MSSLICGIKGSILCSQCANIVHEDIQLKGTYCSNECFKLSRPSNKTMQKPTATEMTDIEAEEAAAMDSTIGRQRSRSTSAISCRFCELVDGEGNPIDLNVHGEEEDPEQDDLDVAPLPPPILTNPTTDHHVTENSTGDVTGNASGHSSNIIGASYHNLIPPPPPYLPNYYPWQTTYPQVQTLILAFPLTYTIPSLPLMP